MKKVISSLVIAVLLVCSMSNPSQAAGVGVFSFALRHMHHLSHGVKGNFITSGYQFSGTAAIAGAAFAGLLLALTVPNIPAWSAAKSADEAASIAQNKAITTNQDAFQNRVTPLQVFFSRLPGGVNYGK